MVELEETPLEEAILETLTTKVRFLSVGQIERGWPVGARRIRAVLQALEDRGLLLSITIRAVPECELRRPLCTWTPGQESPELSHVAYMARRRWTDAPVIVPIVLATDFAANVFAGHLGVAKPASATHDLHLGGLYLRFLAERPAEAATWTLENDYIEEREGQVLPDVLLRDEQGHDVLAIEMLGRYRPERLVRLHQDCRRRGLPYEFW